MNNFCILCYNQRCTAFQLCCTHCIRLSPILYLAWLQLQIQSPVLHMCKMPCFIYPFVPGERPRCLFSACKDSPQSPVNARTGLPLRQMMLSSAPTVLHYCTGTLGFSKYFKNISPGLQSPQQHKRMPLNHDSEPSSMCYFLCRVTHSRNQILQVAYKLSTLY